MICVLKAILGFVLLIFLGTNIIGAVVRSLFLRANYDDEASSPILKKEIDKLNRGAKITNYFFYLIAILFFYGLYHFWNIGVVVAGAIIMISRLPDLLFEIRTGKKITMQNMPKNALDVLFTILFWLALPILWYSLCYLN